MPLRGIKSTGAKIKRCLPYKLSGTINSEAHRDAYTWLTGAAEKFDAYEREQVSDKSFIIVKLNTGEVTMLLLERKERKLPMPPPGRPNQMD